MATEEWSNDPELQWLVPVLEENAGNNLKEIRDDTDTEENDHEECVCV